MNKTKNLLMPAVILIAVVILGGFYYASEVNKQRSIERQQEIKLQEDRRIEEARAEQTKKEYIAKRKNERYSIYEKERNKWNNVESQEYDEKKDSCVIRYKANNEWKGKRCEDYLPKEGTSDFLREIMLKYHYNCTTNTFTNEF